MIGLQTMQGWREEAVGGIKRGSPNGVFLLLSRVRRIPLFMNSVALSCHSTREAGMRRPGSMKGGKHHFLTDTLFYSKSQSSKHPARSQPQELREESDCFAGFPHVL